MNPYLSLGIKTFKTKKLAWSALGICGFLLLLIVARMLWRPPGAPVEALLTVAAGLLMIVSIAYSGLSIFAPRMEAALLDSHYERFRRLEGAFRSIPKSVRKSALNEDASAEFESLCQKLEGMVDPETCNFTQSDAADYVHNLSLLFLQVAPPQLLSFEMGAIRADFRKAMGPAEYEGHINASNERFKATEDQVEKVSLLRAEATYLVQQTRRQNLIDNHVETTRQRLMSAAFRSWWYNAIPFLAVLAFYLFCHVCADRSKNEDIGWYADLARHYFRAIMSHGVESYSTEFQIMMGATFLALVGIAGASGGMLSVIQRVQGAAGNIDAGADLRALSQAEAAVFFAPVTGVLFAFVLSAMLAGGVVSGTVFPQIEEGTHWYFTLWQSTEMAKWLVWAFIAGFSERLVPDMLNSFAKEANVRSSTGAPTNEPVILLTQPLRLNGEQIAEVEQESDREDAPASNPAPVLHSHPEIVPSDAEEVTVTGEGFNENTELTFDGSVKAKSTLLEVTATSIRFQMEPSDLVGKTQVTVIVKNPPPGGGESQPLTIPVGEIGG